MENERIESELTDEQNNTPADAGESTAEAAAAEMTAAAEKKKKSDGGAVAWIKDILIAVVIALIISQFITPTIVQEHSMDDTLHNNDYLIIWKMAYKFSEPDYGDIIVFKSTLLDDDGNQKLLIKRVIAKSGDTIAVRDGFVYRNGEKLTESYTKDGYTNGGIDETTVPDGKLFLLGDNRIVSVDSRDPSVGFVDEDVVMGKAVLRLFPFDQIGGLYADYTDE